MPEYFLTGIQTETLLRDLSPIQGSVNGTPHGAGTHPPGAAPPAMWITEDNLDATQATAAGLPAADVAEFRAKTALRIYAAFGGERTRAIDLFGAGKYSGPCCQLISQGFFGAVDRSALGHAGAQSSGSLAMSRQSELRLAGLPTQAISRMTGTLAGARPIAHPRQLTLSSIAQKATQPVRRQRNGRLPAALQPGRTGVLSLPGQPEQVRRRGLRHDERSDPPLYR